MPKIIVMTDLHIVAPGERIIGLDPSARFYDALSHALRAHGDAERLVLTGDLTHHGRPEEYAQLRALLADVPMPISFLLGNHDDRAAFRAAFPEAPVDESGFVQSVADAGSHRLICLDTLHPETEPYHGGFLCAARLAWLEAALSGSDRPCVVFQHHPPMDVGFAGMDAIRLANGAEELELLSRHDAAHLVAGHVHRTISGSTASGLGWTIFKSPCHQMPMMLEETSSSVSIDEPGAFGLLILGPDGVVLHSEDVGLPRSGEIGHDGAA